MVPTDAIKTSATTVPHTAMDPPALPGSYALLVVLDEPLSLEVGHLGWVMLAPGRYVYFGSAMGPGGLRARIGRHSRPDKVPHWHIDYLTQRVPPVVVHWQIELPVVQDSGKSPSWNHATGQRAAASGDRPGLPHARLECIWCQRIARCAGVTVPVRRFGSTDCRSGCPAHLLRLPDEMTITQLLGELT